MYFPFVNEITPSYSSLPRKQERGIEGGEIGLLIIQPFFNRMEKG
jgi:hypothetical protein